MQKPGICYQTLHYWLLVIGYWLVAGDNAHAPCPIPNAPCPMPNAPCPMPNAPCPHAQLPFLTRTRRQAQPGKSVKSISFIIHI